MIYDIEGTPSTVFPDITKMEIEPDGLIAIGGDLTVSRILTAYSQGVFPMPYLYEDNHSVLAWWSFPTRLLMFPDKVKFSKSWLQRIRKHDYEVKADTDFKAVITACQTMNRSGGWITPEIISAYTRLHRLCYAHSVEVYQHNELAGGLYGLCLGNMFVGESMFHFKNDMSKIAFYYLVQAVKKLNLDFIDCQQETPHFLKWGGTAVSREDFFPLLQKALQVPTLTENWSAMMNQIVEEVPVR
ncbi:MAG: leucyl/phenylalanyl-tRNA--protein transferase [Bacteroidales bacterium]|nr:leucyl/phenylalanyl-tRNA--protein transferase [Bacteroidales bacterium]